MPVTLNGFNIVKSPRDLSLLSYPVIQIIAAGANTTISLPNQVNGVARSIQFINNDGANAATIRVNGVTSPAINLPASGSIGFSDQWITQVQIVAGAAGTVTVMMEVVPF